MFVTFDFFTIREVEVELHADWLEAHAIFVYEYWFYHYCIFFCGIILPFSMEPLNTFLAEELRSSYEALQRSEERCTKLVEESLWLEARLDQEVERTENLRRWFQHFLDLNASLSAQLTNLREHCARLERRIIVRDNSLSPIDYDSDRTTLGDNTPYESDTGSIDLWE
jgi:hypothetical protein